MGVMPDPVMHKHLGGFALLKPRPGVCEACAVDHPPDQPHNQQSLYYQYWFYGQHGRWPKWEDALAHCTDEVYAFWREALADQGVVVRERMIGSSLPQSADGGGQPPAAGGSQGAAAEEGPQVTGRHPGRAGDRPQGDAPAAEPGHPVAEQ